MGEERRHRITLHLAGLVGVVVAGIIIAIGVVAAQEATLAAAYVTARQLYGLTAFGVLMGACLIGPLAAVCPRLPLRGIALAGRRAIGVAAGVIAVPHVLCYLGPVLLQHWRELYAPGALWVLGLVLGSLALIDLIVLAWTSRDAAVLAWGAARWKRLHRTVYMAMPIVFLHAVLIGADFGRATPAGGTADTGSLIVFACLVGCWLSLMLLRHRGLRWPTRSAPGAVNTPPREP